MSARAETAGAGGGGKGVPGGSVGVLGGLVSGLSCCGPGYTRTASVGPAASEVGVQTPGATDGSKTSMSQQR